jgi:hypothetical protein
MLPAPQDDASAFWTLIFTSHSLYLVQTDADPDPAPQQTCDIHSVPVSGPVLLLVPQLHLPNASLDMKTFTRSGLPVPEACFGDSCHSF